MMWKSWQVAIPTVCLAAMMLSGCGRFSKAPKVDLRQAYVDARATLLASAEDVEPDTRSNALEALASTLGDSAGPVYLKALQDEYPSVRFAAAMAIGEVLYEPAKETLAAMAATREQSPHAEPDKRVLCAIIYALHRMGDTRVTGELGSMLYDNEKQVRADAAMVMGMIGEPSAMVPLRTKLQEEQDARVQLQIVESLAMLGDEQNAIRLEAYTKTQFIEDRLVAIDALTRRKAPRAPVVLNTLLRSDEPAHVRVAAAGALARLGDTDGDIYRLCVRAVEDPREVFEESGDEGDPGELPILSLQRLAAISLGWMRQTDAVDVLYPLLNSDRGLIRVAAAMSIVRLGQPYGMMPEPAAPVIPVEPGAPAMQPAPVTPVAPAAPIAPAEPAAPAAPVTPVEPAAPEPVAEPVAPEPAPVVAPAAEPVIEPVPAMEPEAVAEPIEEPAEEPADKPASPKRTVPLPKLHTAGGKD